MSERYSMNWLSQEYGTEAVLAEAGMRLGMIERGINQPLAMKKIVDELIAVRSAVMGLELMVDKLSKQNKQFTPNASA